MRVTVLYHIFRLKYRCFVYALSMIVSSLYRVYPISHTLYRIPYIVYPKFHKISNCSKFFQNFKKIINLKNFKISENFKFFQKIYKIKKISNSQKKFKIFIKFQFFFLNLKNFKIFIKYMYYQNHGSNI